MCNYRANRLLLAMRLTAAIAGSRRHGLISRHKNLDISTGIHRRYRITRGVVR